MGDTVNAFERWAFRHEWIWYLLPSAYRERAVDRWIAGAYPVLRVFR